MYRYFLLIAMFLMPSCNDKVHWCVNDVIQRLKVKAEFDYEVFSKSFEEYLIKNNLLNGKSLKDWIKMYEDTTFCSLDYEAFVHEVDNTFATSPLIGGAFFDCAKSGKLHLKIDLDSIGSDGFNYTLVLLQRLGDGDFQRSKMFFVYQTNVLLSYCN